MRIHIKSDRKRLNLILPNAIVLNRLTAHYVVKRIPLESETTPALTTAQMTDFFHAIKQYKKTHPDFLLVEVRSADGDEVTIKL